MISKFAQLEFKHGESSRGQTMFESLVSSYPRRVDIWSVYIDMLIKAAELQKARYGIAFIAESISVPSKEAEHLPL